MENKPDKALCRFSSLADPGARGIVPDGQQVADELIVVRVGTRAHAYRNQCPHTGAPLNWLPDQFFDIDGKLLQCSLHMALFELDSGHCIYGPCHGQSLPTVPVQVVDDWVVLDET